MPRFSHADSRYKTALAEMGRNLQRLLEERDWKQADLVRAAKLHMPLDREGQPERLSADNISNMVNGKRRPTRPFVKAVAAAFGVDEAAFMPSFLKDAKTSLAPTAAVLSEVPGRPGYFRVTIDREFPSRQALQIVALLDGGEAA